MAPTPPVLRGVDHARPAPPKDCDETMAPRRGKGDRSATSWAWGGLAAGRAASETLFGMAAGRAWGELAWLRCHSPSGATGAPVRLSRSIGM